MLQLLALAAVVPTILAQTYYGCYVDPPAGSLSGSALVDYTTMTITDCETHCTGFDLWAVEYGGECTCGNSLSQGSFPSFSTDCNVACPGDPAQTCGGGNRISLWGTSATPPTVTPWPHAAVTAYQDEGCWTETSGVRALSGASGFSGSAMTIEECGAYCLNNAFFFFGLEYASECWCGTALNANSTNVVATDCGMACSGDATQICGGPNRLSVYQWV